MPAMSTPHTQPPALTGFLGLPSELRLRIYSIILSADLDTVDVEKFQWFAYGTSKLEMPSVRLPITNLAQSCRLIANEVRDHIGSQPAKGRFATMSMQALLSNVEPPIMRQTTCQAVNLARLRVTMNLTISRFDVFTFGLGLSIPSIARQRYTTVMAGSKTQLHSLFRYDGLLRGSGLLDEIQILLHLSIQQDSTRTEKKHNQLVRMVETEFGDAIEKELGTPYFEEGVGATVVRFVGFSSDPWTEDGTSKKSQEP